MALQKVIQTEGKPFIHTPIGVIEQQLQPIYFLAYIKVVFVSGNKTQIVANVNFKNETFEFNKQYEFAPNMDGGNFIAQAYNYLKTKPEFAGATDC
jgi:hypothetical protein